MRRRVFSGFRQHRWPLGLFVAALIVRICWARWVHPPGDFLYSDMVFYAMRARRLVEAWGQVWPDETFYPWGTHYLLGAILTVFRDPASYGAGMVWAALNAPIAPLGFLLARRLYGGPNPDDPHASEEHRELTHAVAQVAGLFMVVYYPALSYAGYYLSESPFMVLVTAAAWFALRLVDGGRRGDAFALGLACAAGFAVRPQMAAAVGILFSFLVWRRKSFPRLSWHHAWIAGAPLAIVVSFSTYLAHKHTHRLSPLPLNGAVNRVFGRCHNAEIVATDGHFGPPAFGGLHRYEKREPNSLIQLRPVRGHSIRVPGTMRDTAPLHALADRCVAEGGQLRQGYYAITHVALLWGYHVAWPDMGVPAFRLHMRGWTRAHLVVFVVPALIAMAMGSNRRWPRHGVLAVFLWSLLASTMLFMGSARLRVPYDVISVALGLDVYARAAVLVNRAWRKWKGRSTD